MTTESDLLKAVLAAPADDTPRLVYADWLEEYAGDIACPTCHGSGKESVYQGGGGPSSLARDATRRVQYLTAAASGPSSSGCRSSWPGRAAWRNRSA